MKLFFYFLFTSLNIIFCQTVSLHLKNYRHDKVYLSYLKGEKIILIDSAKQKKDFYSFSFKKYHSGIFRFSFKPDKYLNFVYDKRDIQISSDFNFILDSLKFIDSWDNKIYNEFIKFNKSFRRKTDLLNFILARFPQDDKYFQITQKRLIEIESEYLNFVQNISQKKPKSFIARYVGSSQIPLAPPEISFSERTNFLKSHALDNVDFNDYKLIYSDVFTNKTIEYLSYYRNPKFTKEQLEENFYEAVDTILGRAKVNIFVYQQITDYLIDGFKKYGFNNIIDYIVDNYVIKDDLCLDEKTENSIQKRISQAKFLAEGTNAPIFKTSDINGNLINLSKINSERILIVFYASWCPHCQKLLPKLNKFYKTQKNLSIIAISLDYKKEDCIKFINDNKLEFTNINDKNGWESDISSKYFIYATPTMFILDKDKKIISKPTSFNEFKKMMAAK